MKFTTGQSQCILKSQGATHDAIAALSLSAEIERALRATGYPALRGVGVAVHYGTVVLRGQVPSYHMKQLAQSTSMVVLGVREVCNELHVTNSR